VLFQKSKGGFMSKDEKISLLIHGPPHILEHITAFARSYIDGGYQVVIEKVQAPDQAGVLNLVWENIRPNIEIKGIVMEVKHEGVWVCVGLPDNPRFFVSVPHVHQRRRLTNGTHAKLKVASFNRADRVLNLELLSTSNP
jgi:hypothetical protein